MAARRFERSAASLFGAVPLATGLLAYAIAAFPIGQTQAQPVNPPYTPPPPTFNTTPSQSAAPAPVPVVPALPAAPGGSSSGTSPAPQIAVPPASVSHRAASEDAGEPVEHHHHVRAHWRARYHGYARAQMAFPSYYPGLGLLYPPYANPCRFLPTYYVYYGNVLTYRCNGW